MDRSDLESRLREMTDAFNNLSDKKSELSARLEEATREQCRLQGEHRLLTELIGIVENKEKTDGGSEPGRTEEPTN